MKLLYFDDFKLGVLKGDAVVDVSAEVNDIPHTGPGDLMNGLIERWALFGFAIADFDGPDVVVRYIDENNELAYDESFSAR